MRRVNTGVHTECAARGSNRLSGGKFQNRFAAINHGEAGYIVITTQLHFIGFRDRETPARTEFIKRICIIGTCLQQEDPRSEASSAHESRLGESSRPPRGFWQ